MIFFFVVLSCNKILSVVCTGKDCNWISSFKRSILSSIKLYEILYFGFLLNAIQNNIKPRIFSIYRSKRILSRPLIFLPRLMHPDCLPFFNHLLFLPDPVSDAQSIRCLISINFIILRTSRLIFGSLTPNGSVTTITIEKLGNLTEVTSKAGGKDPYVWAQDCFSVQRITIKMDCQLMITFSSFGPSWPEGR